MLQNKKPTRPRHIVFIAALLLFASFNAAGQTSDNNIEAKTDSLLSHYTSETPGAAVAVVKDGKIIFKKGYGMANLEYDIPITPKTVFHIASVSKQFTAFSIYLLEKQGKLSLSDDIRKYIPEVPDFGKPITIKHLCYHTSGLKDQWALLTLAGWRMDDVITTEQILKLVSQQKELNFPTGTQFKYSNTGYTLMAEIVKRVSGQSLAEFAEENIFKPLGMHNTLFYDDHEKIVKNRAYSYAREGEQIKKRKLNYSTVGATSLFTTAEDLAKWAVNFESPVVGDPALIKKFNEPALLDNGERAVLAVVDGETIYHAKGQFVRNYRGLTLYNHTGGDAGFRTYLARFPDQQFSVIALSNDQNFSSLKTGLDIAEFYLGDALKEKKDVQTGSSDVTDQSQEYQSALIAFEGTFYSPELKTSYTLTAEGDKLIMTHPRLSDIELTRTEENKFSGKIWFGVEIDFLRDEKSKISGLNISNFGAKNVRFEVVE